MKQIVKLLQLCTTVLLVSCSSEVLPPQVEVQPTTPPVVNPPNTAGNETLLPPLYPFSDKSYFIKGESSATASLDISAFFQGNNTPNLGSIINNGEKLNMIAMGGGLTAGVRNGGLYRVGQMTAFPNLVAWQMGMSNFQSPLFSSSEANGTGYLELINDGSSYPTWKEVKNNIATVKAGTPPALTKYQGNLSQNYGLPENGGLTIAGRVVNTETLDLLGNRWSIGGVFASRILPDGIDDKSVSLREQILKQPINFYLLEDDSDMLLSLIKNDGNALSSYGYERYTNGPKILEKTIELLYEKAKAEKGVVFTWPIITDLAYFNWYTLEDLKTKAKSISINGNSTDMLFIPSQTVDNLFRNLKKGDDVFTILPTSTFLNTQILNNNTQFIKLYNDRIKTLAKEKGLALVDLEKIYHQIHINQYVSADGFKIDGGTRGNFFSADGIYPTAIGQAVIANEVIKAINQTYNASIPQINLQAYSKLVGKE